MWEAAWVNRKGADESSENIYGNGRLASLQFEMNMLPVMWEEMKRSIDFWVHVMRLGEGRLLKRL